mgnify:CR=1 FL=1
MTIGERIKEVRTKLGMTQVAFADKIGVSKQTLYKYENNIITNIPSDKIEAVASISGVSPSYLMGWNDFLQELGLEHEKCSIYNVYSNLGYDVYTLVKIYSDLPQEGKDLLLIQAYGYAAHYFGNSYKIEDESTLENRINGIHCAEDSHSNIIQFSSAKEAREYLKTKENVISAFITDEMTDDELIAIANTVIKKESENKQKNGGYK